MDIVPTCEMWRRADMGFGLVNWHWYFLDQKSPFPERVIAADPDAFYLRGDRTVFDPEALDDYLRCAQSDETIHAMCEDYRAGATYDFAADEGDRGARRITCPVLALWSGRGELQRWFDMPAVWRQWADDVRGRPIDCGTNLGFLRGARRRQIPVVHVVTEYRSRERSHRTPSGARSLEPPSRGGT